MTPRESKLLKVFDLTFVPTSYFRATVNLDREGKLFPKLDDPIAPVINFISRKLIYSAVVMGELGRCAAYYETCKTLYNIFK